MRTRVAWLSCAALRQARAVHRDSAARSTFASDLLRLAEPSSSREVFEHAGVINEENWPRSRGKIAGKSASGSVPLAKLAELYAVLSYFRKRSAAMLGTPSNSNREGDSALFLNAKHQG